MEWEDEEITSEPMDAITKDGPVTRTIYANENSLLDSPGWKRFRSITKREKKMIYLTNQVKLGSYRNTPK